MPLDDIRVVEWTAWQQGPIAGALLADMGAEVIKVEELRGEPARGVASINRVPLFSGAYFHNCNRGKKGIALDLRSAKGIEVLYDLVEKADVFLTNRLDSNARNKYDWETLHERNPRLIYAYASSYGPEGPDADYKSGDLAGQARGGLLSVSRPADLSWSPIGSAVADEMGGFVTAYGILLALIARHRTGHGQRVDTSLLSGQIELGRLSLQMYLLGSLPAPSVQAMLATPLVNLYPCQDGKWIALCIMHADKHWAQFCETLGLPDLITDPDFSSSAARAANIDESVKRVRNAFATKPRDSWVRLLREAGIPQVAPAQDYAEVACDPQVMANHYIVEVDDPNLGKVKVPGIPVKLSETPGNVRSLGPELGQHTDEVLLESLGYTWDRILRLREEGVIL